MSNSEQMLEALEQGNLDSANILFQQALQEDDDETLYNLAGELYALGFTGQAKQIYERLLTQYPEMDELRTALADIAVADGELDAALNLLGEIAPSSDSYVAALLSLADVYQSQGLYEAAEQKLIVATQLAPDEPVIVFALGELYLDWGRDAQAAAAYQELLASGEERVANVAIASRLGTTLANLGQYEDAVAAFESLPEGELDLNSRFLLGGLYAQLDEHEEAENTLRSVIEADATFANAYLPLAQALAAQNKNEEALLAVQDGLAVDETNPSLFAFGADLALKLDDQELAATYLKKARAIDPDDQSVQVAWSNLLVAQHRDEENVEFIAAIVENGSVEPQLYWNLGKSYQRLDEPDKARENYLLAFNQFQSNLDFLRDIIDFFQSISARAELKSAMTRYLQLEPDDFEMQERFDTLEF